MGMLASEGTDWRTSGACGILHMITAQVGGPVEAPQAQLSLWAMGQLPEMERWRHVGGCSPVLASKSAALRQNLSLGGRSRVPRGPPNGIMLSSRYESSGGDILREA